ncbi:hypothetical protein CLV47_102233 [Antricoccus suffuscus]|uniref:Uncharacterized protein n=1 Tax=Antricoccus suffuscus TaxID=1629062 RepID=A0A2T1A4M2_9ACTN|nr:hypothetical protein [Antricoccus suffuscus]PRZ43545.1 hypothetical protein CLV47_102233 [Antricoccus suffuscus]
MTYLEADSATPDPFPERQFVDAPHVTSLPDLVDRWHLILDGEFFDQRSVWMLWFDERGHQLPVVVPIDGLPDDLDERFLSGVQSICNVTRDAGAHSFAMALSRRGTSQITTIDKQQTRALLAWGRSLDLKVWPIHLATSGSVREITVDDLA